MTENQERCKYEDCNQSVYKDGFCIFHLHKLTAEEKEKLNTEQAKEYAKIENKFREEFYKILKEVEEKPDVEVLDFQGFQFPEIDLSGNKLEEILGRKHFQKKVNFGGAVFSKNVRLYDTEFKESVYFGEAEFQKAYFWGAEFQSADFWGAKFKSAYFIGATFESVNFWEAKFQSADFRGAEFHEANFRIAEFQSADFMEVEFQSADFSGAEFQSADFSAAKFFKKILFKGFEDKKCFNGACDFRYLEIDREALVSFEKVSLGQASFTDTDLERVVFRDVNWYEPPSRLWHSRKQALWDEFRPLEENEKERDYEKIAENYRQLVLNYERKRDFDTAEQFHIGEMEMRRKKQGTGEAPWRRRVMGFLGIKKEETQKKILEHLNAYSLYKLLSNYGTSYWQALGVLFFLVLLFSTGFLYNGFSPLEPGGGQTAKLIDYEWAWPWNCPLQLKQRAADFGEALTFSLSILTFQHSKLYEPSGAWTRCLVCLAVICFYSQTALLLLAVRRRFKR